MSLKTLLNPNDRAEILERLRRVRRDTRPAWGNLDAPRMLCHVADQMRVALGDIPSKPRHSFLWRTVVKSIVVNTGVKPPRGKAQTSPEMLTSHPSSWDADLTACIELVDRVAEGTLNAVHPAFGPLSSAEWGRLCWKHLDHHLTQFGV